MEKLVLIDGNSLINRAFYAMPLLTTKDGVFTNAVYGFMNMFIKMIESDKPDYIAVAFDVHAPTFRHQMYKEYKGTRKPSPMELPPQISLLKEVLTTMGVKTIEKAGIEADDIIGTLAKSTKVKTIIYTGDKDSFQLVDKDTEVHFTRRGLSDVEIYNDSNFTDKTEIIPKQIIELKSLMGDASDNIPGVPGIGEKTAKTLIKTYGDIDNLYNHLEDFTGKLKEKIIDGKDSAYLSHTLATIDTNCDIDKDLESMRYTFPFKREVKDTFIKLEFKSLFNRAELFEQNTEKAVKLKDEKNIEYSVIDDREDLEKIKTAQSIVFGNDGVNIFDGEKEYFIKIQQSLLDDGVSLSEVLSALKGLFTGDNKIIVFDKKELKHFIERNGGYFITCRLEDLSILKYLVDFSGGAESLESVITEYGENEKDKAYSVYRIFNSLYEKLIEQDMESLYKDVELPLADVLFDMENAGFKIDINALYLEGEKLNSKLKELEIKIRELAEDKTLNVNSPKQLGDILFNKLKVGKGKKTKTGYSTSAEVLEELEDAHPIIPLILEYRQIQKINSTYIEGFKPLIDKTTGIIKTSFNQTVTSTGRLSSKEPNLQNIPVRDELGRNLRKFFVPRDDEHILISADYSQIELRLLAAFSNTQSLIDAFKNGIDIHTATASKVFKVDKEKVTPKMRRDAKAVNFGVIYGISEYGLAKNIKVSPSEAKNYINSYFNEYKEVKEYMDKNVEFAKENGYAITMLKRRRYIKELASPNFSMRQFGERAAMNMPLQGSAADVIKLAMLNVYRRLKKEGLKSKLILQIHDELIIDALISEKEKIEKLLTEEMENAVNLSVKLTVSLGFGKTWYEAK